MLDQLAPGRLFSMEGGVLFITGGAGGIAAGLCRGFAAAGATLVLADRTEAVEQRAAELRAAGALAPGYAATEFSQANVQESHEFIRDWTPAKRWGTPEDLCEAALLLASDAGAYINGQTIYVDGGFLAVTR